MNAGTWRGGDLADQAARALAEQADRRRAPDGEPDLRPAAAPHRHLGERDGEPAARHVLAALDEAAIDGLADERLEARLEREVERRRAVVETRAGEARVLAAREAGPGLAHQQHLVAVGAERRPDALRDVVEQPDDPDLGGRRDRRPGRLVVQRDVAAGHRQAEGDAGVRRGRGPPR